MEIRLKHLTSLSNPYPIGDGDHGQIKPEQYQDSGVPYIRVQNLSFSDKIETDGMVYISEEVNRANAKSILHPGDILVAKTGATIGKAGVLPDTIPVANTTSSVGKITIDVCRAIPKYVYYCIASDPLQKKMWEIASTKSAQPGFNIEDIKEFKINLPNLSTQGKIVDFLDKQVSAIEELISKEELQISNLINYRTSLIDQLCLNPNFLMRKLKYVSKILRGGSPRPIDDFMTEDSDGLNWIKIGDTIKGNKYIDSTDEKILRTGLTKTRSVKPGDLILSNSMSFGQPYILNIHGCIHDGWLVFSDLKIDVDYLYYSLLTSSISMQFKRSADGGVVQNLNIDKVGTSYIYFPESIDEQKRIAFELDKKCNVIDRLIALKEEKINKLKEYKKSLIYECVTGRRVF